MDIVTRGLVGSFQTGTIVPRPLKELVLARLHAYNARRADIDKADQAGLEAIAQELWIKDKDVFNAANAQSVALRAFDLDGIELVLPADREKVVHVDHALYVVYSF